MDTLPWHLQIKIYNGIGIDTLRKLGIKPGKLKVQQTFKESLEKCLLNKICIRTTPDGWQTLVTLKIIGTNKFYDFYRRSEYPHVYLYIYLSDKLQNGNTIDLQKIIMHHYKKPMKKYESFEQILLS